MAGVAWLSQEMYSLIKHVNRVQTLRALGPQDAPSSSEMLAGL